MRLFRSSTYSSRSIRMIALAGMCLFPSLSMATNEGDLSRQLDKQAFGTVAELLNKGDRAYRANDMQTAVNEYEAARKEGTKKVLPPRFRQAVDERYAQALAQLAYQEARAGKKESSVKHIDAAMKMAPQAPGVRKVKLQLEDVVQFNPAASEKNAENVAEVNQLLQKAFGSYDLGDFDQADNYFDSVLSIDSYNKSARRGKEKVDQARQRYYNSAYDQTRSKMLEQVSAGWETPLPPLLGNVQDVTLNQPMPAQHDSESKQKNIIFENVNLEDVNLMDALDFVRRQARRYDKISPEAEKGINLIADIGSSNDPTTKAILDRRFNVKLRNAPLSEVLRYIAEMSGTQVRSTPYATKIVRVGADSGEVQMRSFRVSPDFFASGENASTEQAADPFASGGASSGLSVRRSDPKSFFEATGIKFPAGTSVQYNAFSSTLTVRNTPANLDLIEDLIAMKMAEKPAQVIIKATFLEVSRKQVHELGFDWVIGLTSIGEKLYPDRIIGGGSQGNGGDVLENMPPPAGNTPNPTGVMTAGLRSGDEAFQRNSLDSIIAAGVNRTNQEEYTKRAPGILSVRAIFSNGDISMVMRGLDQKKDVDTLQQPQIIARSGQKATFTHSREFIYPTDYTEPQLPSTTGSNDSYSSRNSSSIFPVTPSHPTGFSTRSVGVNLEVEPSISEDRTMVDLRLIPEMVDFDGFVNFGNPIMTSMVTPDTEKGISSVLLSQNAILMPVFSKRSLETSVTVASGYTVVLGGLVKSKKEKFEDKVPIFGDIPYFGRLFRSEGEKTEEKVLIIMVHADVVDPSGQSVRSLTNDPS